MRADIVTARAAVGARRLARPHRRDRARTSARRPGSRCRTAAGATRSTPPAWTRTARRDPATTRRAARPGSRSRPEPGRRPDDDRPDGAGHRAADGRRGRRTTGDGADRPSTAGRTERRARAGADRRPPADPFRARLLERAAASAHGRRRAPLAGAHVDTGGPSAPTPAAAARAGCTCRPPCAPPRRTSAPAAAAARAAGARDDLRDAVREGREGNLVLFVRRRLRLDGRPARGWPRSRPPCCRCCSTPTSAATRSA